MIARWVRGLSVGSALVAGAVAVALSRPHPSWAEVGPSVQALRPTKWLLDAAPREGLLFSFQLSGSGGAIPQAPLIVGSRGELYGTASDGGAFGYGTVFKATPGRSGYKLTTLYAFQGNTDGSYPVAGLLTDSQGALYGTTVSGGEPGCEGGSQCGTVFKLTPARSGYTETVLHRFQGGGDGSAPFGGLIEDATGALYGATTKGGGPGCPGSGSSGCGVVYKLSLIHGGYKEHVLHRFSGNDGASPISSLLNLDGTLFGTTTAGGPLGLGTVFALTPSGSRYTRRVIYSFQGGSDGATPAANLIADASGALYSTTESGGGSSCWDSACGTVFKLTPAGSTYSERVLYAFKGALENDGADPASAGLILNKRGDLFGTTISGGITSQCDGFGGCGTAFELLPRGSAYIERVLYAFPGPPEASQPQGGLAEAPDGSLFGTTQSGGQYGRGAAYRLAP